MGAATIIGTLMHLDGRSTARLPRRMVAPATQAGLAVLLVAF